MKALKTVWNVITTVLVALVVVLAILLVGVRVVDLTPLCGALWLHGAHPR